MSASFVRRPSSSEAGAAPTAAASDPVFQSRCPALWEYMTLTAWEDGSDRQPATLILLVEEGRWKGCVSDRAAGRVGWRSHETLAGLLEALEAALASDSMDWRKAKAPPTRRGR